MTKPFMALLSIALVLGIALGAAFIGGIVLGKSQAAGTEQAPGLLRPGAGMGGQAASQRGGLAGREGQSGAGQVPRRDPESTAGDQLSTASNGTGTDGQGSQTPGQSTGQPSPRGGQPPAQGTGAQGVPGRGSMGRGVIAGTIESVDGEILTISTLEGPVEVTASPNAKVIRFSEAALEDLSPGLRVRVLRARIPDANDVRADSILIVPEDAQGFFGRRPGPRER